MVTSHIQWCENVVDPFLMFFVYFGYLYLIFKFVYDLNLVCEGGEEGTAGTFSHPCA